MTEPTRHSKTLLGVSLMCNVFLVCALAGGAWEWRKHSPAQLAAAHPHGLRQALAQLPEQRRHELRHLLRQARAQNQPLIAAGRQARQGVVQQLQASTLDREALDKELGQARQADVELRARVDHTLAEFASTLEPDERIKLAGAMHLGKGAQAQN